MADENPVVEVAKTRQQADEGDILTLSTGVRVKVCPVSASLIAEVQGRIPYPDPPTFWVEAKGRDEPNSSDPHYKRLCDEVDQERGQAALDAFVMFGLELVDGLPDDDGWIRKLQMLGVDFDADDEVICEFHYKKHVAVAASDLETVQMASLSPGRIADKEASFRGK